MLRSCALEFHGRDKVDWEKYLKLMEFAYNNSYQASIGMAPYSALYGWPKIRCRTPVCWYEVGERELTGAELVDQTTDVIRIVKENQEAAQSRQKSYADVRRVGIRDRRHGICQGIAVEREARNGRQGKLTPR